MADVLLTHSYHLPYDRKQLRKMQPYPPLGTLYAAAVLRQRGFSVAVFDTMLTSPEQFDHVLTRHKPAIVVVYEDDFNFLTKMCLTRMREVCWEMLSRAKRAGAVTIVHGSDATDNAAEYLSHGFDYVVIGEAEFALRDLVSAILERSGTASLAGLAFLDSGEMVRTPPAHTFAGLDTLPPPARDLISLDCYRDAWQNAHGSFSLNMISSRGCPFRCNWCAKPIFGDSFRVRPAADVAEEMFNLKNNYAASHIWFGDDIFALNRHWASDFANEVQKRGRPLPFKVQSRADLMTADTVDALGRAGCSEVWMGAESGSQRILDAMDKGLFVSEIRTARENLRRAGIRACYFLQFGYPGETWDDIEKTVQLVRETRPDDIGVSLSYPLPNTRFHERVRLQLGSKRNWIDSEDLCVTFKATYTDSFYRAVRDALHNEVEIWHAPQRQSPNSIEQIWRRLRSMEPHSRNVDATFPTSVGMTTNSVIPLAALARGQENSR